MCGLVSCNTPATSEASSSQDSSSISSVSSITSVSTPSSEQSSSSIDPNKLYNVNFFDADGSTVLYSVQAKAGEKLEYKGKLPFSASTKKGYYNYFDGWDINLSTYVMEAKDLNIYPIFEEAKELSTNEAIYEINDDGESYTLLNYSGTSATLAFPWYYNNKPITIIGQGAFADNETLVNIALPPTCTTIATSAFNSCLALVNVNMTSSNVTKIGSYAFYKCTSLTKVYNSPVLEVLENNVFEGDNFLEKCHLPETVTSIGAYCFSQCFALTDINIPTKLTKLEEGTFYDCRNVTSFVIPEEVATIGANCFFNNRRLTSLNIPEQITVIEPSTFQGCLLLPSINIPYGLTSIGAYAFANCSSIKSFALVNSQATLTSIGTSAFADCSALTSFILPKNVTTVADTLLCNNVKLSYVELRGEVTSIGYSAFANCTSLKSLTLPTSVKTVGDKAFMGSGLSSINLSTIDELTEEIFEDAASLTNIILSNKITSIPDYAFAGATSLASINLPSTVTSIGSFAFRNTKIAKLNLASVQTLALYSLSSMANLDPDEFSLPSTLKSIGLYAFMKCSTIQQKGYVNFNGTMAQFQAIEKDSKWDVVAYSSETDSSGAYLPIKISSIICQDGTIANS